MTEPSTFYSYGVAMMGAVRTMMAVLAGVCVLGVAGAPRALRAQTGTQSGTQTGSKAEVPVKTRIPADQVPKLPPGMNLPNSPKVPTTFDGLFAERDARATAALEYMRCLQNTLRGVQTGMLGQVPRAWIMTCVQEGEEWRGVFVELTNEEPGAKVQAQFAVRSAGGMPVRDKIDTAKAAGVARAMLRGVAAPLPGDGKQQFMPVPLPQKTFIELWFLPVPSSPSTAVVGGDSLIQMSLDGTRELGHSRTTPPIRTLAVTSGTEYLLKSTEERIPLLSELMVAHMALSLSPDVRVRTYQYESVLTRGTTTVKHIVR